MFICIVLIYSDIRHRDLINLEIISLSAIQKINNKNRNKFELPTNIYRQKTLTLHYKKTRYGQK